MPETQPLKAPASATTPATPAPATTASTTPTPAKPTGRVTGKMNTVSDYKPSTIKRQERDINSRPPYTPLEITFLTGAYTGQTLDLGFNVVEMSESQTAEWTDNQEKSIRGSSNFNSVSLRTFNFSLEFWSNNEDIRQLVENVAHIQEITDTDVRPPLLQMQIGSASIEPVVCNSFEPKYDTPLPGGRGFRHATVSLAFKLLGGKNSKHLLAPPLASTPLRDYKERTTQLERSRQGLIKKVGKKLAECLSENASQQITDLLERNKLGDVDLVLKLPAATFIQVVTAGMSKSVMSDPRVQDKLRQDLALIMAQEEDGVNPGVQRDFANALYRGDPSGLSRDLLKPVDITSTSKDGTTTVTAKTLYEIVLTDYQTILKGLQEQNLDAVFDISTNPTAHQRLNGIASCGIDLRNSGGLAIADTTGSEAALLAGINRFLADSKTTDDDIKKTFKLSANTPETVIRKLRQSNPYKSKQQFLEDASYNRQGITAYSLWSAFDQSETTTLNAINELLKRDNLSDDDIKKAFGVSSEEDIKKLRNGGKPFTSKQQFLESAPGGEPGLDGKSNEIWNNFRRSNGN